MSRPTTKISTTVRNAVGLYALRLRFLAGTWLAPDATVERAARLFCTPYPSGRTGPVPLADGAEQTWLTLDDQRIAAYQWGDPRVEPYVLFSHGWASHGARILPWVAPLRAAGYAVVAFDQTAHGRSAGTLATLPGFTHALLAIGECYGPAAAVIGHSLGGAAAMLALAQGLQAARAILIAPAADPVAAAQRFARFIWMGEHLCQRMFASFQARLGIGFEEQQAHRNVPRIARPALVVHDAGDDVVPWDEGERYARYWPGSRLLTTQGLGHRRIVVDPAVIAAGLRFLRGEAVGERVVSSPNLPLGLA
jgi:pimeloyl-ACP methyl ester carboxylesterase